ncbi:MAG: hypothetical protein RIC35_24650 [Marinoscillum sp.]
MKTLLALVLSCSLIVSIDAAVIQVNNNSGSDADYELLQEAIDEASYGDTLYISGSPNYYDGSSTIRLNKRLTLIGPGYFLGENLGLANNLTAKLYALVVGSGADGSRIMGLDMTRGYTSTIASSGITNQNADGSSSTNPPDNITFERNIFYNMYIKGSGHLIQNNYLRALTINNVTDNTIIQNNIFSHGIGDGTSYSYTYTNLLIQNNILNGVSDINGADIVNNIFVNDTNVNDCDNGQIKNNVFTTTESGAISATSTGNTIQDNLFEKAEGTLFVSSSPSIDADYKLNGLSPAKDAGFNGVDAGAYGGSSAYVVSGIPPIPNITELTTTGTGTTSGGIQVRVKATVNQ